MKVLFPTKEMPCRPAISSMSLGRCYAGHSLSHKLSMAVKHGMQGIELFYEDLVDIAGSEDQSALLSAARYVSSLCTSLSLHIVGLQPFMHYEGLLDRQRHKEKIEEMKVWIQLAQILETDIIQIPSSFLPPDQISPDVNLIVSDLREVAELGLQQAPLIRFVYESLCWGTYVDTWEKCWDIVQRVDRPNFGICLDTFNILGRIYADPGVASGKSDNADEEVRASIHRLIEQIRPHREKLFFIQVVDAERLAEPLRPGHPFYKPEQPSRMSWSRNCRLFYGETDKGAYLPVKEVMEAIVHEIGFEGWVSMELFNWVMESEDKRIVEELAERAGVAWGKLVKDLKLSGNEEVSTDKDPQRECG